MKTKSSVAVAFFLPGRTKVLSAPLYYRLLHPAERTHVLIEQKAGWTPQPVWTFRRRYKSATSAGIRTPDFPARSESQYSMRQPGSKLLMPDYFQKFLRSATCLLQAAALQNTPNQCLTNKTPPHPTFVLLHPTLYFTVARRPRCWAPALLQFLSAAVPAYSIRYCLFGFINCFLSAYISQCLSRKYS